jgi:two-component system, OmpR family, copper resistance phosphate regulon response regulator CusR
MTDLSSRCHLQVIEHRCRFSREVGLRILVIEDEARIQSFLTRGLEAGGYTVVSAGDGREGLDLATRARWDLVVLDLLLPELNGLEVLRELHRAKPELPVVVLSARGDVQTKLRGFELGATDYLAKPFSLDELLARIRVRLRRDATFGDEHVLRGGNVVLDVARRQARVGDRTADLSDREFRLLHHLLLHAGEVVSREQLLAEVWGYDFDPGSNVVEVCVRRLRQKLGPDAAIETVRHAGYRLAAA